ncbi:VOC family protein [Flavobacteriaceae bacterium TP-CH-4]|uniref:VOC family protein n=1 Tax=Pelagihabitans pacificus TaxID=2696054 RepID=A0A967AYC7_9FLAO|nr:VOC family protein [Pelagihabitans pacificus]NHF61375.1 VOC family protein [Pelagihabitans pacificus]
MINAIQNFQIPVTDFERAHKFYSNILGYELQIMETPDYKLGIFQFDFNKGVGGSIIKSEGMVPSDKGTMVYLHTGEDLQPVADRVRDAGGQISINKSALGPNMGYFAIIEDTEGNKVGLYSTN